MASSSTAGTALGIQSTSKHVCASVVGGLLAALTVVVPRASSKLAVDAWGRTHGPCPSVPHWPLSDIRHVNPNPPPTTRHKFIAF